MYPKSFLSSAPAQLTTTRLLPLVLFILLAVTHCQEIGREQQIPLRPSEEQYVSTSNPGVAGDSIEPTHHHAVDALPELHKALDTMQSTYFELWVGKWPDAIDWTAAVMSSHVSAALQTFSEHQELEIVERYFPQITAYYFGEEELSIMFQANDDMLWVVLGWLESIKFVNAHSRQLANASANANRKEWHGKQFEAAFAHRARIFYDLAFKGWETELCGGGMVWDPRLEPYKNAITNELFIAASIGMYLHFPGDVIDAPFVLRQTPELAPDSSSLFDKKYLDIAVEAYAWLNTSGFLDHQGLYTDGFHISGWSRNGSIGTGKCDERNNMVYTYNQGVILSGLRGLWEATGNDQYLRDGHELVSNVLKATGWRGVHHEKTCHWSGLGRGGILEEACDFSGSCNQDGQTFKGIFFHHLAAFCKPLPLEPVAPGKTHGGTPALVRLHSRRCREYAPWVEHNGRTALQTRDKNGKFGMWWGARTACDCDHTSTNDDSCTVDVPTLPEGAEDYRRGQLDDIDKWGSLENKFLLQSPFYQHLRRDPLPERLREPMESKLGQASRDLNDRGRGRTVETQGGGVAVLRAWYEFSKL